MATYVHPVIPEFSERLLVDVGGLIGRRAKALKHKTTELVCERTDEDGHEKLSLIMETHTRAIVRLNIWEDGHLWLGVHARGPRGWRYQFAGRGVIDASKMESFVPAVKATVFTVVCENYSSMSDDIKSLWSNFELDEE